MFGALEITSRRLYIGPFRLAAAADWGELDDVGVDDVIGNDFESFRR